MVLDAGDGILSVIIKRNGEIKGNISTTEEFGIVSH